jgi:hypothetical protein
MPCTIFSCSRVCAARNTRNKVSELVGVELAMFSSRVCRACSTLGIPWSLENPASSEVWKLPPILDLHCIPGVQEVAIESTKQTKKLLCTQPRSNRQMGWLTQSLSGLKNSPHVRPRSYKADGDRTAFARVEI